MDNLIGRLDYEGSENVTINWLANRVTDMILLDTITFASLFENLIFLKLSGSRHFEQNLSQSVILS